MEARPIPESLIRQLYDELNDWARVESELVKYLYDELGGWQKVADHLSGREKVSVALAWKVARGELDSPRVRRALRLPPKPVPIPPCEECGEVHVKKTCVYNRKRGNRARRAWAGSHEDARDLDEFVEACGHKSVRSLLDSMLSEWKLVREYQRSIIEPAAEL